jgi:hypothetical protein
MIRRQPERITDNAMDGIVQEIDLLCPGYRLLAARKNCSN